ncbi:TPA: hypothetical protein ACGOYH_002089, partial [Streptococcus suis]
MKAKNRRRIGYSVIEQYNSLVFLKDFLEDKKLEGYLATLNKSIDEVHRLSISEQQKIINLFPVNIPQIGGDFPKGQNNQYVYLNNTKLNKFLFQNHFDYNVWREENGLRTIKEIDCLAYRYTKFESNDIFENLSIENILFLIKNIDLKLFSYVKRTVENNIIYADIDTLRCVHLPLSETSFLVFPNSKKEAFSEIYILHEISHVILNYYQTKYDIILSLEAEEGLAHFIESAICNNLIKEELDEYK